MSSWRGPTGPYSSLTPGEGERGGGYEPSQLGQAPPLAIAPGSSGGGGHVPSREPLLQGYGGCGGPGPGAYIGILGGTPMAKLTKEERAELEARLAEDDEDDESDPVKITRPDGSAFEGTYRRAKKLGYVKEPEEKGDSAANSDKDTAKRFQSGRRVS